MKIFKNKKAFTMAEAILVMTILGIIATIMISTLKPAEYKDKALAIMAKKVLSEIDAATTQILVNNSQNGKMTALYVPNSSTIFEFKDDSDHVANLYKKYMTATRKPTTEADCYDDIVSSFFLKDGACMAILGGSGFGTTIFPGESTVSNVRFTQGIIYFDVNGSEEPNVYGKDIFQLPIGNDGIMYDGDS